MCALPSFLVRDASACKGMLLRVGTGRLKHMSVGAVAVFGSRSPASHRALCACTSVFSLLPAFWLHDCTALLCVLGQNALSSLFLFFLDTEGGIAAYSSLCPLQPLFLFDDLNPNCAQFLHHHSVSIM